MSQLGQQRNIEYWNYIVQVKHRVMENKEEIVKSVLSEPDSIRKNKIDENIFLYYNLQDKLYCIIVRHDGMEGFLITAYPTDKVKEGEVIWTK
jgi:phage pi2 protein 07